MSKKSIKIEIASRQYPISIDESEEHILQSALENLKGKLKNLRTSYSSVGDQDLLAMTALQLALENQKNKSADNRETQEEKLIFISQKLKSYLDRIVL